MTGQVRALECYGCRDADEESCEHECAPNENGQCYAWCAPCIRWLNEDGDADVVAGGAVVVVEGPDAGD